MRGFNDVLTVKPSSLFMLSLSSTHNTVNNTSNHTLYRVFGMRK